ncbi:MAG TPA: calcium-binding protein [Actinomycetes bacterium]|nr:calcium-binding protein [Actinomycetes bacterium]
MSRRSMPAQWGRVLLLFILTLTGLAAFAPQASAATCVFDPGTRHATAAIGSGELELRLRADNGTLEANGVSCGSLTEIETVTVNVGLDSTRPVVFDLSGGPLGPGFTNENNGSSEVEFTIANQNPFGSTRVDGSVGNDSVTIGQESINGNIIGQLNLNAGAESATPDVDVNFPVFPFDVVVDGKGGNDTISANGVGSGLSAPYSGNTKLAGGPGSNSLTGGSGSDQLTAFAEVSSTGADTFIGGDSFDQVIIEPEAPGITSTYSLDGLANDGVNCPGPSCEGDNVEAAMEAIRGSSSAETLIGNAKGDVLMGGGGADVLKGLGGFDNLQCAGGKAVGGPGGDSLLASVGCASVAGGPGRDEVAFSDASQGVTVTLDGLKNDGVPGSFVNVRSDIENVYGTAYRDIIVGDDQPNRLQGGAGRDDLSGAGGNDRLEGHDGSDALFGGPGDDILLGGKGDDSLNGGEGTDDCRQGKGTGAEVSCE